MRGGAASEVPNLEEGGAGQRESRQADCHTVLPGVRLLVGLRIRAKRFAMTNLYCHPEAAKDLSVLLISLSPATMVTMCN